MECIDLTLQEQAMFLSFFALFFLSSNVAVDIGLFAENRVGVRPGPRCTEFCKMTIKHNKSELLLKASESAFLDPKAYDVNTLVPRDGRDSGNPSNPQLLQAVVIL